MLKERLSLRSPSEIKALLNRYQEIAQMIINGLEGRPFRWGDAERQAYTAKALRMGCTLVTRTRADRLGWVVRQGAEPVGVAYFGAPIQRYASLFVLECQCKPKPPAATSTEAHTAAQHRVQSDGEDHPAADA